MIEEAYCSYEISKLLKEKGFDESTQFVWYEHLPSQNAVHNSEIGKPKRDYFYWEEEGERNSPWTNNSPIPSYISGEVYSCPTHQMACAWLREKHGLHVSACILEDTCNDADGNEVDRWTYWSYDIISVYDGTFIYYEYEKIDDEQYQSHDAAIEAALKYALENLI